MYLDIAGETVIKSGDIIGIFDMDTATVTKKTRDFLYTAEKEKRAETVSYDFPKAFILCGSKHGGEAEKIYITPLSVSTILKRLKK